MRIIFFYLFLILNHINFQYVPGLRFINDFLTSIRIFFLRMSGSRIGSSSILRPKALLVSPRNLEIGSNTIIGSEAKIMNFAKVNIGSNVEIGPNFVAQTNEHLISDYQKPLGKQGAQYDPIIIGDGCYFGGDVTVLSGVSICKNCIIGAKSIVTKNISESGVYAGCPAKLIKEFPFNE